MTWGGNSSPSITRTRAQTAYPSERDIEHALYPDALYVIVSLLNHDTPEAGAFRISEGVVTPEPLSIERDPVAEARITPKAR